MHFIKFDFQVKFGTVSDVIGSTSSMEKKEKENKTATRTTTENMMSEFNISDTSAVILPVPTPSPTKSLVLTQSPQVELKELPKRNMKFRKPMVLLMKSDNKQVCDLLKIICF